MIASQAMMNRAYVPIEDKMLGITSKKRTPWDRASKHSAFRQIILDENI